MSRHSKHDFTEERIVCGGAGLIRYKEGYGVHFEDNKILEKDISDVIVKRVESHPWFIVLWEPLTTKIPNPCLAQPWCCYADTVIFYYRGYILDTCSRLWFSNHWQITKPNSQYLEWGRAEHDLRANEIVIFENEEFEVSGGSVAWANKQWWMLRRGRRKVSNLTNNQV